MTNRPHNHFCLRCCLGCSFRVWFRRCLVALLAAGVPLAVCLEFGFEFAMLACSPTPWILCIGVAHAATCPVRFAVSVAGCGWFGGNDIGATLKTGHSWGRGVAGLLGSSGFGLLSTFRPAFAWSCSPVILLWTNKGCQCTFISINKPNFTAGLSDGIFVSLLRQLRLLSSGSPTLPSERVEHDHAQLCYQLPFAAVP